MVKNPLAKAEDARDPGFDSWVWKKEIATRSSILAWKIPWIEEPGGLIHGFAKNACMHARTPYVSKYEVMFLYTLTF